MKITNIDIDRATQVRMLLKNAHNQARTGQDLMAYAMTLKALDIYRAIESPELAEKVNHKYIHRVNEILGMIKDRSSRLMGRAAA